MVLAGRSTVASSSALVEFTKLSRQRAPLPNSINGNGLAVLRLTWPTVLGSKPAHLQTSDRSQRLAPLGGAFSATPRAALPYDVSPCILRTNGWQRRGSDSRLFCAFAWSRRRLTPCGQALVTALRKDLTTSIRNAVFGESMYDSRGLQTHALADWRLEPAPCTSLPLLPSEQGGTAADAFARCVVETLGPQLRGSNTVHISCWHLEVTP